MMVLITHPAATWLEETNDKTEKLSRACSRLDNYLKRINKYEKK